MSVATANPFPIRQVALAYLIGLIMAEFVLSYGSPFVGILFHSAILISLIVLASLVENASDARTLSALTFISSLRVIAIISPLSNLESEMQALALSICLFTLALIYLDAHGLKLSYLRLRPRLTPLQLAAGGYGLFGGVIMGLLHPQPHSSTYLLPVFVILITVFVETLLFYGLMLPATRVSFSTFGGVLFTALYYTLLFAHLPVAVVALQFVMLVLYGVMVVQTRSLSGVLLAHSVSRLAYGILIPLLFATF